VACCTFNCTFVDRCFSFATTFSSLASFCIVYASTKCSSVASFSFNSSMHIGSTNATLGPIYSLIHQCRLLLRKNLVANVLNYRLRKLYLLIIHLPFRIFRRC
jgi:hypothetical protein